MANPIPAGLRTLTPQLTVDGADRAIELYKKAFGAEEVSRAMHPDGKKIWHAEVRIGDSAFFINDEFPEMGPKRAGDLWIYSEQADDFYQRAVQLGFKVVMPMTDQFWGDRSGTLIDPFGNQWTVARRVKEMSREEMVRAGQDFARSQAPQP